LQRRHEPRLNFLEIDIEVAESTFFAQCWHQHFVDDGQVNVGSTEAMIAGHGHALHANGPYTRALHLEDGHIAGSPAKIHD
jgi:hypothetical protein